MHQSNTRIVSYFPFSYLQGAQLSFTSTVTKGIVGFYQAILLLMQQEFLFLSRNHNSYWPCLFFFALTYWPSLLTLWLQVFLKWRFGYLLCGCGLIGVVTALWRDIQPCGDSFVMLLHIGFCPFSCLSWMTIVKGPLCSAFFAIHFLGTTCASG